MRVSSTQADRPESAPASSRSPAVGVFLTLLALVGLVLAYWQFSSRAWMGINLFEFGDETEKFVAAQMIQHGGRLYGDVFAHHGPLLFMLAQFYAATVSATDFNLARYIVVGVALIAMVAVAKSPLLTSTRQRLWTSALFGSMLSSVWLLQGMNVLLYHVLAGCLLAAVFAQMVGPAMIGIAPRPLGTLGSGLALTFTCFLAYSFGPVAMMLTLSTVLSLFAVRIGNIGKLIAWFLLGCAIASTTCIAWLWKFGDLKGFLVFHFYFNQSIYSQFIDFKWYGFLENLLPSLSPHYRLRSFVLALLAFTLFFFGRTAWKLAGRRWMSMIALGALFVSVLYTNPRGGSHFIANTFYIFSFVVGTFAVVLASRRYIDSQELIPGFAGALSILFVAAIAQLVALNSASGLYPIQPSEYPRYEVKMRPQDDGMSRLIRSLTEPEDRILALIFNPGIYIKSGRLPATGQSFYLPWQATYHRAEIAGYPLDICKDIRASMPRVIIYDDWRVWERYSLVEYEPCLVEFIKTNYTSPPGNAIVYIRNDIGQGMFDSTVSSPFTLAAGPQLSGSQPIELGALPVDEGSNRKTTLIEVKIGTYARQNAGAAKLVLTTKAGKEVAVSFRLNELSDNEYQRFSVPKDVYTQARIESVDGGGVSAWSSVDKAGRRRACVIQRFDDRTAHFTPGCPLY